ncbi:type VI secretion ATPase, ClpV1 family [Klebsiella pneumoniae]|uniref:Type VI secretion ATPase, ClpV1 family n=1 Tax=Klebsiella pneumoniae TaxID=573 RepID=A0A4P0Y417_KLEPN|nr:type VI secretion ATPase, ClpV1 family [Klebsiella pneumoniae]
MRNRLTNDATSLVKQPPGQSRYRMVVHWGGRNIDSLLNQQLLTHMAAGPKPQHPDAERDEEEGNASRGVSAFLQEVLPDYYYPLELKHPEQYTRPDI